jgi:probable phosphoglycerate mutase
MAAATVDKLSIEMTTFLLIRHAVNDWVDHKLAGWLPGVHLNQKGREQAARLAARLGSSPIGAVLSSPLERARETAAPLAAARRLEVEVSEAVGEIRCGDWTGREIVDLDRDDPLWRRFNVFRGGTRAPAGELMLETQTRMVNALLGLHERYAGGTVAVVSHGDPLRAMVGYFLGAPIDLFQRFEISPASVTVLGLDDWGARLRCLNDTSHLE